MIDIKVKIPPILYSEVNPGSLGHLRFGVNFPLTLWINNINISTGLISGISRPNRFPLSS